MLSVERLRRGGRSATTRLMVVLALLSFITPLATDAYLPAFPEMTSDLVASPSGVQFTLTAFMAGLTVGQLAWGPISDRWGRRRPLMLGLALASVAGIGCAVAPSVLVLDVARVVQGIGGAAGLVIGRAVVADVATGRQAARLFSLLMALVGIAPVIAPLLGGVVTVVGGWRAVFAALAAVTLLMLFSVLLVVPETHRGRAGEAAAGGTRDAIRMVLADSRYCRYTLSFALSYGTLFCYVAGAPFVFGDLLGLSTTQTSLAFAAAGAIATATGLVSARLVTHTGPRPLLLVGLGVTVGAAVAAVAVTLSLGLGLATALVLFGALFAGLGLILPNATALALDRVPRAAGTGSALLGALQSGTAAVVAPLMGLFGGGTAVPMVVGMAVTSGAAVLVLLGVRDGDDSLRSSEEVSEASEVSG